MAESRAQSTATPESVSRLAARGGPIHVQICGESGLRRAFAGSRCAQISDALRVCYLEYSPLRLGGDLIFKLLKRIVASQIASQRP